jgi:signal transduction histidine kinase
VIEQALLIEKEKLDDGEIELITLVTDDYEIEGDADQIEQVLINLISNARQAMPQGGTLTLKVNPGVLRDNDAMTIEIRDTGAGIPAENMRELFTPFFTTRKQGTGLGLPICQRIIQAHQGELKVASSEKGAIFTILLPLELQKRPGSKGEASAPLG